jgi:hypothetical protein
MKGQERDHTEIGNRSVKGIKERKKEIILFFLLDGSCACCDITRIKVQPHHENYMHLDQMPLPVLQGVQPFSFCRFRALLFCNVRIYY